MSEQSMFWKPLAWDTQFFGFKTARIIVPRLDPVVLDHVLAECCAWGAQVIYYLADSDHDLSVRLAEEAGFHLVDIRVTLAWKTTNTIAVQLNKHAQARKYRLFDLAALQEIARRSYNHSRYYYDHHYPRERCDALYAEWVSKSCAGEAEQVLIAEREGQPVGFVTCHLDSTTENGQIGLVGIHEDVRGLGIGRLLLQSAQQWFGAQGVRQVEVVTQGRNIAAQRLYQREGFVTSGIQLWYHKWLDERATTLEKQDE